MPMTTLVSLTIATPIALVIVALLPAWWLQRFVIRGFPSQRPPPSPPPTVAQLPMRSAMRTTG